MRDAGCSDRTQSLSGGRGCSRNTRVEFRSLRQDIFCLKPEPGAAFSSDPAASRMTQAPQQMAWELEGERGRDRPPPPHPF